MSEGTVRSIYQDERARTTELLVRAGVRFPPPPKPEESERAQRLLEQVLSCCRQVVERDYPGCEPVSTVVSRNEGWRLDADRLSIPIIEYRRPDGRLYSCSLSAADLKDVTRMWIDERTAAVCVGTGLMATGGSGWFAFGTDENGNATGKSGKITAEEIARFAFTRPRPPRGCCIP
jgi:hypothetical protein